MPLCCLSELKKRRLPSEGGALKGLSLEQTNVVAASERSLRLRPASGLQVRELEYCPSCVCRCRPEPHDFDSLTDEFVELRLHFH